MKKEPVLKRTVAFVDGQNLFHMARKAFGYPYPNYDILGLASEVCSREGLRLVGTRFYTGVPEPAADPFWSGFWRAKTAVMGRQGVFVFTRPIRRGKEKGIDVRIAIDVIRMAHRGELDVALLFSQDQDLSEVADEIRLISREQDRWLRIVSAFPCSARAENQGGIDRTDWIRIDRATYDRCLDSRDYRPPRR